MATTKAKIILEERFTPGTNDTRYVVEKLVNTIDFKLGDVVAPEKVRELIESGVQVTIQQPT